MKEKIRRFFFLTIFMIPISIMSFFHVTDAFIKKPTPISQIYQSNNTIAWDMVNKSYKLVEILSNCKSFPIIFSDFFNEDKLKKFSSDCVPMKNPINYPTNSPDRIKRLLRDFPDYKPWIDPWGRPYQIRYDLERGKLQVRSQGRYLWTELDDIVGETFFDGKMYKAQVEYCKTVPKDDMSCVFNRGWH